ncbi:MAG: signal peptidase I [Lachnospiraceae bacterium]|nr:signal peptidase I [Lachnospiraceae bacterium]
MNSKAKEVLSTSIFILCVLIFSFLIVKFVGQRTEVIGPSMNPTLVDGDNLILDKISYRFHDPERYDIVVFPFRNGESKNYIKRIIGLPGEKVRISEEGEIYINGEVLHESYGLEVIKNPGTVIEEMTLGEGEYFVLGDNRNNSEDSRFAVVGAVKREEIIGRAWLRVWPLNSFGFVKHR